MRASSAISSAASVRHAAWASGSITTCAGASGDGEAAVALRVVNHHPGFVRDDAGGCPFFAIENAKGLQGDATMRELVKAIESAARRSAASPPRAAEGGDKPEGCTALTLACEHGQTRAVERLCAARADAAPSADHALRALADGFKALGDDGAPPPPPLLSAIAA